MNAHIPVEVSRITSCACATRVGINTQHIYMNQYSRSRVKALHLALSDDIHMCRWGHVSSIVQFIMQKGKIVVQCNSQNDDKRTVSDQRVTR